MSVIMTLRAQGDPQALERWAGENSEHMGEILERAKERGLIAHRFYGSDGGRILVVDEWPDRESFDRFFEEAGPQIEPLLRAAGVSAQPEISCWRKLETGDEFGWTE